MSHGAIGSELVELSICGARCALGPIESAEADIEVSEDRIARLVRWPSGNVRLNSRSASIDLSGYLVMPGLINAHDHLEFALFPRLADPPYRNYVDWGEDIHGKFPQMIAKVRAVPKSARLWWGGIRNLLCGVTTVCHHNPLWPTLQRNDFPVRVLREYGWAHSLALGGDLLAMRAATPQGRAFVMHACEGVDEQAREELWELDRLSLLDKNTILVHGLAIDREGVDLLRRRGTSLIICPTSNSFLFHRLPDVPLLSQIEDLALGNDSPLTAEGDLLDEIRFAIRCCGISPEIAYRMVTAAPASILKLENGAGSIRERGVADLLAVRDTGAGAAERLRTLSAKKVEFVMIRGRVQLASETVFERLPLAARDGLEPLWIDGVPRWVRSPIADLLRSAEEVLGADSVTLSGRQLRTPATAEANSVC